MNLDIKDVYLKILENMEKIIGFDVPKILHYQFPEI